MGQIIRDNNNIRVIGDFDVTNFLHLLASMHKTIDEFGYSDVVLDFAECSSAFPNSMLGTCAQVMNHRNRGVDFELVLPTESSLSRLFNNANWAYLIDPRMNRPSNFRGYTQIPATQYRDPDDQQDAVNQIIKAMLSAIDNLERESFAAFEWSVNELTDNVLTHAESEIGGLVQVSTFARNQSTIQFIVADAGLSIPNTLRTSNDGISDLDALDLAIREGVTRDKSVGQGNGLYGSYQICSDSKGKFEIISNHGHLTYSDKKGLHITNENIPYQGTLVIASIDFSDPHLLKNALKIGGEVYIPTDFVETNYEADDSEEIIFVMREESKSFGSRPAGAPVRNRLKTLRKMTEGRSIKVDFEGIPIISSSFADEVFGKLFVEIGPMAFGQCFNFVNISSNVRSLIDKAIMQRMSS